MGNKPVKVAVRLDQNECRAGEVLTGKVYLSVGRLAGANYNIQDFRGIHLLLNGFEHSQVAVQPGTLEYDKRRRHGRPFVERSTQTIVNVDYPLVDLTGLTRGQYEYPFQLPLRHDLPGSFTCSGGDSDGRQQQQQHDKSFCEIKYTLTAYIAVAGVASAMADAQLSHRVDLPVKAAAASPVESARPIRTDTAIFPITSCWFWNQGHIALGWACDRSHASPNDTVNVRLWGENQSKLKVECVSVKWMETITWRTQQHGNHGDGIDSDTKTTKRLLAEQRQPVNMHAHWRPTKTPHTSHQALLEADRDTPEIVCSLKIPTTARDTYKGQLVEVRHTLVVCAVTAGGYTSTTPESSYAVRIRQRGGAAAVSSTTATSAASAPLAPSAPSEAFDTSGGGAATATIVEAQALPDDWQPVEAEVVSLPVASAVIIDESIQVDHVPRTPIHNSVIPMTPPTTATAAVAAPSAAVAATAIPATTIPMVADSKNQYRDPVQAKAMDSSSGENEFLRLAKLISDCPENLPVILEGDASWAERARGLSPRDFCQFVDQVASTASWHSDPTLQAAEVARTLAIAMGPAFQTRHVLACLWATNGNRMALLERVAPLASDLHSKRSMIEDELGNEELRVFQAAL